MKLLVPPEGKSDTAEPRIDWRRKGGGLLFAISVQLLIALMALTLTPKILFVNMANSVMESFNIAAETPPAPVPEPEPAAVPQPRAEPQPRPEPPRPQEQAPTPPAEEPPPIMELPREVVAQLDIAQMPQRSPPARAPGPMMGPPDLRPPSRDSQRVEGSGPNGEPLYAASWYREPYPEELRGYLSTAHAPSWGMIACRTVREYRVEDCVIVGESPSGSGIGNAVLQASWQFRVRPPILRGQPQYGEWVRIRIDYERRYDRYAR